MSDIRPERLLWDGPKIAEAVDLLSRLSVDGLSSVRLDCNGMTINGPDLHVRFTDLDWQKLQLGWWQAVSHKGPLLITWQSLDTSDDEAA